MRRLGVLLGAVVCIAGCEKKPFTEPFALAGGKTVDVQTLNDGHEAYMLYCYGCHGKNGDGQGPAAPSMRPPPRNFKHAKFKFAGVPAGNLPTDEALDRVIRRGLHGTPMLPWDIAPQERHAIIQYIKTFKTPGAEKSRWQEEEPGAPIEVTPDPWKGKEAEAIAKGEAVYHVQGEGYAGCSGCHAGYAPYDRVVELTKAVSSDPFPGFREDFYRTSLRETQYAIELDANGETSKAHQILVPDFLFHKVKTAYPVGTKVHEGWMKWVEYTPEMQREDLYRTIAGGIDGAAMPTWKGAISEENLWALTYYVQSLVKKQGTPEATAMKQALLAQAPWHASNEPAPGGEAQKPAQ